MSTQKHQLQFKEPLRSEIDQLAKEDEISTTEVVNEAVAYYIEKRKKWNYLFQTGQDRAKEVQVNESDIWKEIEDHRNKDK